jgi:hypothetical protein
MMHGQGFGSGVELQWNSKNLGQICQSQQEIGTPQMQGRRISLFCESE